MYNSVNIETGTCHSVSKSQQFLKIDFFFYGKTMISFLGDYKNDPAMSCFQSLGHSTNQVAVRPCQLCWFTVKYVSKSSSVFPECYTIVFHVSRSFPCEHVLWNLNNAIVDFVRLSLDKAPFQQEWYKLESEILEIFFLGLLPLCKILFMNDLYSYSVVDNMTNWLTYSTAHNIFWMFKQH